MRRFPFFIAPLLGIAAFFFLFKVLFLAFFGLAVFGTAFMAVRGLAGRRFHAMHEGPMQYLRPVPVDAQYREPAFYSPMAPHRTIEVI